MAMEQAFFFQSPLGGVLPALSHVQNVVAQAMEGCFFVGRDAFGNIQDIELIGRKGFEYGVIEFALQRGR
jgi:hypothetical protein